MSTVIHPVGPKRPEIYWRRRVLALVVTVLLVIGMVFGVRAVIGALIGGGDEPDAATQEQAVDTSGSEGSESSGPAECAAEQISLAALSDATSYAVGGKAKFGTRITNTGKADCTMDAGSAALELTVVSGKDRIWSSDDCQESAQNVPTTITPGEAGALESSVEWTLVRSAKGCAKDLPALKAGTYQLVARAGEFTSPPLVFAIK